MTSPLEALFAKMPTVEQACDQRLQAVTQFKSTFDKNLPQIVTIVTTSIAKRILNDYLHVLSSSSAPLPTEENPYFGLYEIHPTRTCELTAHYILDGSSPFKELAKEWKDILAIYLYPKSTVKMDIAAC